MAERPAPLVLVVQASPAEGLGTYAAVAATGQALLAAEMSLRLEALGAAVVPLAPVVPFAPDGPPAGQAFHWGRWYTTGARAALDAAATDGRRVEALGYTGAGALALVDDDYLHALISPIPGEVVANNRYSADAFAVAGDLDAALAGLERCRTDNAAVRCLEAAGFTWRDPGAGAGGGAGGGAGLWSRFDVDTPLDLALLRLACRLPGVRPLDPSVLGFLETATLPGGRRLEVRGLAGLGEVLRSRDAQLVVAGRVPASAVAYLETESACRVRCFIEERGMRSARDARPRSLLADWAARLGAGDLLRELTSLGDAVILDSRVVMAALAGSSDASAWPPEEERFASDFLDPGPVTMPWLAELTVAAAAASGSATSGTPVLLGGHALVSDGLRILVDAAWLGR